MRVHLIGVAGGSGAGKSWLTAELSKRLGAACERLCLDDFYLDRSHLTPAQRARINFDHPRAIDWALFGETLERLVAGRPALVPLYDFSTHCRGPARRQVQPQTIVMVEGLWAWYRTRVRRLFELRVFIECSPALRLERRLERDTTERGRTEEEVRCRFARQVEPMHRRFVEPLRATADIVLCSPEGQKALGELEQRIRQVANGESQFPCKRPSTYREMEEGVNHGCTRVRMDL